MIGQVKGVFKPVNKDKNLVEFLEKNLVNKWVDEFLEIDKRYKNNIVFIEDELKSKFDSVCKLGSKFQEQEAKGEIKYIYFSLLRTSFFKNEWLWRIDLYDEKWFLDKTECSINISLDFIYNSFFQKIEELKEKKKEYGRSITDMDIEDVMIGEADKYHILATEFLKSIIDKLIKVPCYENLKKTEDVKIMAGEYIGASEVIYPKQDVLA
ncbi:hypothetical protein [Clostridium sp.]|uniref:hypothetical protein n=1 Tax=Clostridium sp. TaxID=1506 RepID=UPI0026399655|nr:hypothetical protein [Clostridium sp.]